MCPASRFSLTTRVSERVARTSVFEVRGSSQGPPHRIACFRAPDLKNRGPRYQENLGRLAAELLRISGHDADALLQ
jgi:endonuclease YncB( thermonuclease family)